MSIQPSSAAVPSSSPPSLAGVTRHRRRQLIEAVVVFALIALLPLLVKNAYLRNVIVLTLMYAALAQSWNILGGYCGQISLGHALYFGVGAYAVSKLYVS
jgi:branched-chain amino acid transport system permease protein